MNDRSNEKTSPFCTPRWRSALLLVSAGVIGSAVAVVHLPSAEPTVATGQEDNFADTGANINILNKQGLVRCAAGFLALHFDPGDFNQYDSYFTSNAVMQVAQTGIFAGPQNIREYVGFLYANSSPYLIPVEDPPIRYRGPNGLTIPRYGGLTSNGECIILVHRISPFTTNPVTTRCKLTFEVSLMLKILYDDKQSKITRINVYYPAGVLLFTFGYMLSTNNTLTSICSTVSNHCQNIIAPIDNCTDRMFQLPFFSSGPSGDNYLDGFSRGCRTLHAAFAATNPVHHCAHVAIDRTADPDGNYKCQQSASVAVRDLFTSQEIASYNRFLRLAGLDPQVGHTAPKNACGNNTK